MANESKQAVSKPSLFKSILNEKLLQYIWQFQYFNQSELKTTGGETVEIINPGKWNKNQGPDFLDAQVRIGELMLAGSVELHLRSSQWELHGHQHDRNYSNVILHVVLEEDTSGIAGLPVLELEQRIPRLLIERYEQLMDSSTFIACSNSIIEVKELTWLSWKERLLAERMMRKSELVFNFLDQNQMHWEESMWWMLARNFGTKINADAFEAMARSIPVTLISRHKNCIQQLEALLLGQAGLLGNKFRDDYPRLLYREYQFLKKKYNLQPIHQPVHYLRMRPVNFPTIRLAQLAALMNSSSSFFSRVLETENLAAVKSMMNVTANDYWHYHYLLDEPSGFRKKTLGKEMTGNLVINTIVPFLFAYGLYHKSEKYKSRALQWLDELDPETNSITTGFAGLGFPSRSAFDSQAFIELKTKYCDPRRCLECSVGNAILKAG